MMHVEKARSGRSRCQICRQTISKGSERVVKPYIYEDSSTFFHIKCYTKKNPHQVILVGYLDDISDATIKTCLKVGKEKFLPNGMRFSDIAQIENVEDQVNILGYVNMVTENEISVKDGTGEIEIRVPRGSGYEKGNHFAFFFLENKKQFLEYTGSSIKVQDPSGDKIRQALPETHYLQASGFKDRLPAMLRLTGTSVSLYTAKGWNRPSGWKVKFDYAKTSRAKCVTCEENIKKDEYKLLKPIYSDRRTGYRTLSLNLSYHILCTLHDPLGIELLHEAITRLDADSIRSNQEILLKLHKELPDGEPKDTLQLLMNNIKE